MSTMARDGSMRRSSFGGDRDIIGLTGVCTNLAGAYLSKQDMYERMVAKAEQTGSLQETRTITAARLSGVSRLRRVAELGFPRYWLSVRRARRAGSGAGVWVCRRWWHRAVAGR
jgi:hypothetical protein